jgi:hypothetical protein
MQQERPSPSKGFCQMEMLVEYRERFREFAIECDRLAAQAKTEPDRRALREMAAAWRELAQQPESQS